MRKKLTILILAVLVAAAQLGLFSAPPARASQCWWLCCVDLGDGNGGGCSRCCDDGPCNQPTCPVG